MQLKIAVANITVKRESIIVIASSQQGASRAVLVTRAKFGMSNWKAQTSQLSPGCHFGGVLHVDPSAQQQIQGLVSPL